MSDSVRPHRWQPTRALCLWDSSDKNPAVGCHFLLQCRKVKSESEFAQSCPTLSDPMDCSQPGSSAHGILQEYWSWVPLPSPVPTHYWVKSLCPRKLGTLIGQIRVIWGRGRQPLLPEGHGVERGWSNPNSSNQMP